MIGFLIKMLKNIVSIFSSYVNQFIHDPADYSVTLGMGSIVPVQFEAYLLALCKYISPNSIILDVGFGLGYGLIISSVHAREYME